MIIVRIWEGLGNQLFQYAYARAISLETNQKVFLDIRETGKLPNEGKLTPREYELKNFQITLPVCTNVQHFYPYLDKPQIKEIVKRISKQGRIPYKYFSEYYPTYDKSLLNIKGNWYLQGWFQDIRYFQKYLEVIKKEIVPKKKIRVSSETKYILHSKDTVSVHVRRSDFKKEQNILPITYYYNALNYMKSVVDKPYWIIFSDDINWVKEHLNFGRDCYYLSDVEKLKDYEELMIMSCCKNHIIANSTYSWWGACLGRNQDKIVLAPDKWFLRKLQHTQILPDEWIQIPIV